MPRYGCGVRPAAGPNPFVNNAYAVLWNPSAVKQIRLREIWFFRADVIVQDAQALVRCTARGTQSATVTPGANSCLENPKFSPTSGAVIDTAWSVQPTVASPYICRTLLAAVAMSGYTWVFSEPYIVPPGEGVAIVTPVATAGDIADITFVWDE